MKLASPTRFSTGTSPTPSPATAREAAVERVLAVVAHQEQLAFGHDPPGARGVALDEAEVEDVVAGAAGQGLAELRVAADEGTVGLAFGEAPLRGNRRSGGSARTKSATRCFGTGWPLRCSTPPDHLHRVSRQADHAA